MNETLSQSQAKSIVSDVNMIICKCKVQMESKYHDFILKVSKIWEDQNAVNCFLAHKCIMEDVVNKLDNNNKLFGSTVEDIANRYSDVGQMNRVSVEKIDLNPNIDVGRIKDHFVDGPNGDDFGFINPSNGAAQVIDAFTELEATLKTISGETIARIQSINAFGNAEIKMELGRSAGRIIEAFNQSLDKARNVVNTYLERTATGYTKAGTAAVDSVINIKLAE